MSDWIYEIIYWSDVLTDQEIIDVEDSWIEIRTGDARKFFDVKDFIEDLKS